MEMSQFSDLLRSKMAEMNINNKGLAVLVEVSPSTVGAWLDDVYPPQAENLMRLAEVIRESPLRLFNIVYGLPLPNGAKEKQADPEWMALIEGEDPQVIREWIAAIRAMRAERKRARSGS